MKITILLSVLIMASLASCAQTIKNKKQMNNNLQAEYISADANAKTLVLFGGNVERRHEIITLLQPLQHLSVHGALSETEGIEMLNTLKDVTIVLIGGRYTDEQRKRIKAYIAQHYPSIIVTEPGVDYPYSNEAIFTTINTIQNETTK